MKRNTLIICLFLCLCSVICLGQNTYQLSFKLNNAVGHKFYLLDIYGGLQNRGNRIPIDSIDQQVTPFLLGVHSMKHNTILW